MNNKSLKTTISGVFAALAALVVAIINATDGNPETGVALPQVMESLAIFVGGVSVLYGMWKARDHDVSSISAGIEKQPTTTTESTGASPGFFRGAGLWLIFALCLAGCANTKPLVESHKDMTTIGARDHLDRIAHDERLDEDQKELARETWSDFYAQKAETRRKYG